MKKRDFVLILLVLAAIAVLSTNAIGDFDTGYHLQTGAFIVSNHFIPTHDIFSYTAPDALWINHYWFADVIFYLVYLIAHYQGLIWFVALMSALTYAFVLATTFLKAKNVPLATLAIIPYGILTYELWVVRPEIFTFFFTAVTIFIFEYWQKQRCDQERSQAPMSVSRILLVLPILIFIWANMHAGVVLGLCIILLYFAHALVFGSRSERRDLSIVALLSLAASLLNPNGYRTLSYSLIIGPTTQALGVEEWKSLLDFLGEWQAKAFLATMILVVLFSAYALLRRTEQGGTSDGRDHDNTGRWRSMREIDWPSIGLLGAAAILPLISIRHVAFFPIMTFPIFISSVERTFFVPSARSGNMSKFSIGPRRAAVGTSVVLAAILFFGVLRFQSLPTVNGEVLPVDATAFIKNQNIAGPMFNDAAFGGWLIWQDWPQQQVFIDGRDDVYGGQVADDYITIMTTAPGWQTLVNQKYHINYFLLWYHAPLSGLVENLSNQLEQQLGFKLVYWNDAAIILVRDDAQNAQDQTLIKNFAYDYISPFVAAQSIPRADRPAAVGELERALTLSSSTAVFQNYIQ